MNFAESSTLDLAKSSLLNMSTMGQRLREALSAREKDPPWLIAKIGSSKGTVYNILDGTTKPEKIRGVTVDAICSALKIRREWLLQGTGSMEAGASNGVAEAVSEYAATPVHVSSSAYRRVPVVGTASLGMDGYWTDLEYPPGQGDGYFDFPTTDKDAYVLQVRGGSMHPAIRSGWYVLVEPSRPLQMGEFVLVKLLDGRSTVKEFLWHRDGEYVLNAVASNERLVLQEDEVEAIHYVGGILPPGARQV